MVRKQVATQAFATASVNLNGDMVNAGDLGGRQTPLFFPQPPAPILELPAQAGYGDKRTS